MKKYMCFSLTIIFLSLIWIGCSNTVSSGEDENTSWVFVANEGNYGESDGSISMIDEFGNVSETEPIGDVVQSLEVYNNKLIVLVNNSHKIKIYTITTDGLSMPGIEISTEGSGPREMVVVDGKVYFTNWITSDVKVFNLFTYNIEASIPVGSMPEGIISDGTKLWVANSGEDTVSEIDITSLSETRHIVGSGPQNLVKHNSHVYVSRTYYSDDWTITYHGASRIVGTEITINNYGSGGACGGSVLSHQSDVYRSFDGGLARMDAELNLEERTIGSYNQSHIYHVEKINGNFWFAITDWDDLNEVRVVDSNGDELFTYKVGQNPGDFALWEQID